MKKLIFLNFTFFCTSSLFFAQVGIGTTEPQATLDINGDLRIAKTDEEVGNFTNILTVDDNKIVKVVNKDRLITGTEEVNRKTIAIIAKSQPQKLDAQGTAYDVIFDGVPTGINTDKITFNANKTNISFPPNKAFKITAMLGLRGAESSGLGTGKAGYITSEFSTLAGSTQIISSKGYTESSTEGYDDGGVTQPIIIFTTGPSGGSVKLSIRYGGQNAGTQGYYLAGAPANNSVGSYIIIEEL